MATNARAAPATLGTVPSIEHEMLRSLFRVLAHGAHGDLDRFPEDAVAVLARSHRLSSLQGSRGPAGLSATLTERFRLDHVATLSRNTFLRHNLIDSVRQLARRGVDAIVLKGLVYDERLYPRPGSQPTSDIDLLVHPRDRDDAFEVLTAGGWAPVEPPPGYDADYYEVVWQRHGVRLDLHLALTASQRCAIDYGDVWTHKISFPLGDVHAWRLADAHAAVHHCLHMAVHHFNGPAVDLLTLTRLVNTDQDFAAADVVARRWRCVRPWRTSVRLAAHFLPWWTVARTAQRVQAHRSASAIIDRYGPVRGLSYAEMLRRSFTHFDSAADVARYLAAQVKRRVRTAVLRPPTSVATPPS